MTCGNGGGGTNPNGKGGPEGRAGFLAAGAGFLAAGAGFLAAGADFLGAEAGFLAAFLSVPWA